MNMRNYPTLYLDRNSSQEHHNDCYTFVRNALLLLNTEKPFISVYSPILNVDQLQNISTTLAENIIIIIHIIVLTNHFIDGLQTYRSDLSYILKKSSRFVVIIFPGSGITEIAHF